MRKIKTNVVASLVFAAMFLASSCRKDTVTVNATGDAVTVNAAGETIMTKQTEARVSSGPSANGQAAVFLDYPGFTPGVQHFSFHANTNGDGNVTGSFETKWEDNGRVHGTINCLSILADGKTAIMSGTVTQVSGANYIGLGFKVGDDAWFKVQDNGEGTNALQDGFSDLYVYFDLETCTYDYSPDLFPIVSGNVQVKP